MDCACVYVGDYDPPDSSHDKILCACKVHKCGECGCVIERGKMYERSWQVTAGDHSVFKTCMDCLSVRKAFFCDGWLFGGVWEQFWEYLQDAISGEYFSWSKLGQVTPAARADICKEIEEMWAEEEEAGRK